MNRLPAWFMTALLALLVVACGEKPADRPPLVLAAASLQDALEEASTVWEAKGHAAPTLSFAATSALARQIESGAPADLFISADEKWMDEVATKGLIEPESRTDLLANRIVLIAPAGSNASIRIAPGFPLARLLGNGRLAMADPDGVPAGRYGKEALTRLEVWDSVADRVVPAENVRAALALVARGEAALGIVYTTDAMAEPGVRVVDTFPADSHVPIVYPIALLKTARSGEAEAFRTFLLSDEATAIFRKAGFETGSSR